MRKRIQLALLSVLIVGVALRLYNLEYFYPYGAYLMSPDESIYTQAVFSVTKGYLPYRDVFIAQPPVHFIIQYPFICAEPSLFMARLPSVLLSFGAMLLIFLIARVLYSENVASLATVLFALSPYALHYNKLAIVDNVALFFTLLSFYPFFKYYKSSGERYLYLSGFFAGLAFFSKYTTLLVIMVLILLVGTKKNFRHIAFFLAFSLIIPSTLFFSLLLFDAHNHFYLQTVGLQLIRFNNPLETKIWQLIGTLHQTLPLFIVAIPTLCLSYRKREDAVLTLLFVLPFLILLFGKVFLTHYLLILLPILCILAARTLDRCLTKPTSVKRGAVALVILLVFAIHFYDNSLLFVGSAQKGFAARSKIVAADYIRSITYEGDKIWTTEAEIAFLAQRLIVATHPIWKFPGFYEDVWGYGGFTYVGQFAGYPGGLITLNDIQEALENEKPKVVVIARYKFADMYIWYGIDHPIEQKGLADYILAHYKLTFIIGENFDAIEIYIWFC